jgi:hypothetical protein
MTKKVWVYDLEQMFNFHCATFLNRDNPIELQQFVIHKSRNDFNEYIEFLETQVGGLIGFNNLNYDYPLIHYLLEEKDYFYSNNAESTANKLYSRSQIIINSEYSEIPSWKTLIPQLDLYRINHFDNTAKRTSLKGVEIAVNFHNVDDLPFKFDHYVQDNEVQRILDYNLNDVMATEHFYKMNIEKIEMRKELGKEYRIDLLNANDPKIGSEIFAKLLSEEMGVNIRDLKQMRTYRNSIKLDECILPYIKFDNKEFKNLLTDFKSKVITETKDALSTSIIYKGFKYDYGLGGIHGCIKSGKYYPNEDEVIHDIDVSSYYPNLAIINKFKPKHLGNAFSKIYDKIYHDRIKHKKGSAQNAGLKLALNGSFGKSNDIYSFFYDPMFTMQITVNGQLLLTMLAEQIVDRIEGVTMLQANTDGITIKYKKDNTSIVENIIKWWEGLTGLQLESSYYKLMVIRDVNNYMAQYTNDKVKYKGAFEIDKEIYKDNSMRIVPIAISNYFLYNIPIQQTIRNHTNIFDFCKRFKSTEGWVTETRSIDYDVENLPYQKVEKQQKNIRYYISNKGSTLMKVHKDRRESNIEKGWQCTIMNKYIDLPIKDYDINYSYYIAECNKIIDTIEDKQLTLF